MKKYKNIEWQPVYKEYGSDEELANAIIEFLRSNRIPFISEKELKDGLKINPDPCYFIDMFGASEIAQKKDERIKLYFGLTSKCYYSYILDSSIISIFEDISKYIKEKKIISKKELETQMMKICLKKYIDFVNDEIIYKKLVKDLLNNKIKDNYIMLDRTYIKEYLAGNPMYIAYNKEKKEMQDKCNQLLINNENFNNEILNLIKRKNKITLLDLKREINNILQEQNLNDEKIIEYYIVNYLISRKSIKFEYKDEINNSTFEILSDEEQKERLRQKYKKLSKEREKEKLLETKPFLEEVKRILSNGEQMNVKQMQEKSKILDEMSWQKLSALCHKWCENEILKKVSGENLDTIFKLNV